MIYLDNAATTPMSPGVLEAVAKAMQEDFGNPGTLYPIGRRAKELVAKARRQVADLIGTQEDRIIFTSGGSESNATVFFGVADWMKKNMKNAVVVSAIEHESVLKSAQAMCMKYGFHLHILEVDSTGYVNYPQLLGILSREAVGLVSVMYMNNEIGTVQRSMDKVAEQCRLHGALFHTDCVQALGSIPVDAEKLACDFLSMSSHKLCGPKGVGALYVSKRAAGFGVPTPLIYGGQNQESGLRGGTENVPGIVGFGRACEEAKAAMEEGAFSNVRHLYDRFINCLTMEAEKYGIRNRFSHNGCSDGGKICSLTITGVDNESLALLLGSKDICVGTGSACSSREVTPSHVLKAIGLSDEAAMSTIRVSFSTHNTLRDVKTAAQEIARCCHLLLNAPRPEGNS